MVAAFGDTKEDKKASRNIEGLYRDRTILPEGDIGVIIEKIKYKCLQTVL